MKVNLLFVYKDYKKDIRDAIDDFLVDFPTVQDNNISIFAHKMNDGFTNCFASHRNFYGGMNIRQEIRLNSAVFSKPLIKWYLVATNDANYDSVKDIIWHELGHSLQLYLVSCYCGINLHEYKGKRSALKNLLENSQKNSNCYSQHKKYCLNKFGWNNRLVKQFLGASANTHVDEFFPECVNNFYRLKNKTHLTADEQFTLEFVRNVITDFKQYIVN